MQINKKYKSMEELNKDLMLLKLQADICKEEIRFSSLKAKQSFRPIEMTREILSSYLRKVVLAKSLSTVLHWVRRLRYGNY